jgi:non-heme chloroperoxidase
VSILPDPHNRKERKAVNRPDYLRTTDGASLFYRDWGTGKPVVFLSGWALNSDVWGYQMVPLSDAGLRCVAYDRRGHGRSSDPGRGYDYDTLASDLAAVLDRLDLRGVTLVGHSMAGGEIVRYLSRYGAGRVAKVAFLAPTLPFPLQTPDNPDAVPRAFFDQVRTALMTDYPQWLEDNAAPFVMPETSSEMRRWIQGVMLRVSMRALLDCNRALIETDFRAELKGITLPTLILHGTADQSAPLDLTGRKTAALVPNSRLTLYEGAPHGLFITHKDRVNEDLLAFVR